MVNGVLGAPGVKFKLLGWPQGPTWALLGPPTSAFSRLPRSLFLSCVLRLSFVLVAEWNITAYSARLLMEVDEVDSHFLTIAVHDGMDMFVPSCNVRAFV